jgi:hypothetical protein
MKIELKRIQHARNLSEETNAFTADIYVNGEYVGYAKNDGHGGCTDYHHHAKGVKWGANGYSEADQAKVDRARRLLREAEEWAKGLSPVKSEYFPEGLAQNLELVIDDLVMDDLMWKDFRRDCSRGVLVEADGGIQIYTFKRGMSADNKQRWLSNIAARGERVLNGLGKEEILPLLKQC